MHGSYWGTWYMHVAQVIPCSTLYACVRACVHVAWVKLSCVRSQTVRIQSITDDVSNAVDIIERSLHARQSSRLASSKLRALSTLSLI